MSARPEKSGEKASKTSNLLDPPVKITRPAVDCLDGITGVSSFSRISASDFTVLDSPSFRRFVVDFTRIDGGIALKRGPAQALGVWSFGCKLYLTDLT
jgi:hypothetical protein